MSNYVDKKRMHEELKDWLKNRPNDKMPEYVGWAIMQIAEGFSRRHNWRGYTEAWKENMRGAAIENCVRYARNYNYEKYSNPHAYFSFVTENTFKNVIKKEKRIHAAKLGETLALIDDINTDQMMEQQVPHEIHSDILQKFNSYGGSNHQSEKKPRVTKAEKAAREAISIDDVVDDFNQGE